MKNKKTNWKKGRDDRTGITYLDHSNWKQRGKTHREKDLQTIIARKFGDKKGQWTIASGSSLNSGLTIKKNVKTKAEAQKEIAKIIKNNREKLKKLK